MEWTYHFIGEAVNAFKFGQGVHEIQLNCCLAEYTVVPNPDGIELALQGIKPRPISVCHSVVCANNVKNACG